MSEAIGLSLTSPVEQKLRPPHLTEVLLRRISIPVLAVLCAAISVFADGTSVAENSQTIYSWRETPASASARILTLVCINCGAGGGDVPLLAVLRDTLGGENASKSRLTDVWQLLYAPLSVQKRLLAAIPFFISADTGRGARAEEQ
jgi:hypothetical protein